MACGNLGIAYTGLGDFKTAIDYHECHLKISKEVGDKAGEEEAYGNLGIAFKGFNVVLPLKLRQNLLVSWKTRKVYE